MKTRIGFVSNSSSSSFCIMGMVVDSDVAIRFDEMCYSVELRSFYGIDTFYNETLLGLEVSAMKEEETLAQFKQRVLADLQKIDNTITINQIHWCVDGGYNG